MSKEVKRLPKERQREQQNWGTSLCSKNNKEAGIAGIRKGKGIKEIMKDFTGHSKDLIFHVD